MDMLLDMADIALAPNWPVHGFSNPPTQTDIKPITPATAGTTCLASYHYARKAGWVDNPKHATGHTRIASRTAAC